MHYNMVWTAGFDRASPAVQTVSEREYSEWSTLRQTALAAMDNRGAQVRDSAVHLERDLSLLGNSPRRQTCTSVSA